MTQNGYPANGWQSPTSNGAIPEEVHTHFSSPSLRQLSYTEGDSYDYRTILDYDNGQIPDDPNHASPKRHEHLRRNSYAGFNSEPKFKRRPSYKKFRSRKFAVKRSHPGDSPYDRPCEIVERVLEYHYEEANDASSSMTSRMVPMVVTWYMTFTEELYNSFKGDHTRHRFWMWLLACLLSTFMALALLLAFAFLLLHSVDLLVILFAASVRFTVFVTSVSFVCCCLVLILNYRRNNQNDPKHIDR